MLTTSLVLLGHYLALRELGSSCITFQIQFFNHESRDPYLVQVVNTHNKVFWELWLVFSMIQLICTGSSSSSSLPLLLVLWPLTYSLLTPILTWTYSWVQLALLKDICWTSFIWLFGNQSHRCLTSVIIHLWSTSGSDLNNICPLSLYPPQNLHDTLFHKCLFAPPSENMLRELGPRHMP